MTEREKWLLRQMLSFSIRRYLMANSCQRLDAAEKAEMHVKIAEDITRFVFIGDRYKTNVAKMAVHDFLADILTDRMDEVIGFPINTPLFGSAYDPLEEKFFNVIVDHMAEIEMVCLTAHEEDGE